MGNRPTSSRLHLGYGPLNSCSGCRDLGPHESEGSAAGCWNKCIMAAALLSHARGLQHGSHNWVLRTVPLSCCQNQHVLRPEGTVLSPGIPECHLRTSMCWAHQPGSPELQERIRTKSRSNDHKMLYSTAVHPKWDLQRFGELYCIRKSESTLLGFQICFQ